VSAPLDAEVALTLGSLDLHVRLRADPGEVVAVLGPNGAGKTTLLRALAGLLPIARGRVRLGEALLEDAGGPLRLPPEQRSVGVVFQDYLLFPHLSARDNVAFGLRARGVHRADARRRAHAWLERVGLAGAAGARPHALSGGQAQRVALARALATEPDLLLLDEPLAALDVEARLAVRRELRRHLDAFAGPCVLITHQPLEAMALADRLVVLERGRVVQSGDVAEVARRPRSDWVARWAGLNLYRGTAHRGTVMIGNVRLTAADVVDGDVYATVRPAAVAVHRSHPEGSPRNVWHGRVGSLEPSGDRVRVQVDVGDDVTIVAEVTPAAVAQLDLGQGGPVWLSVKATEVELYPA
jgi:molybdopterin-binding protein